MKDDELDLWKRFREGDETAREELILRYLPLVKVWAGRLSRMVFWANREDLMQEGVMGLIEAIERFLPDGENEFHAYARQFIRGAILRNPEVSREITRRQRENYRKVKDAHSLLLEKLERKPTFEEIAEETGLTVEQIINALDAASIAFAEEFPDHDAVTPASRRTVERQDEIILIQEALSRLKEKEVLILTEHYWAGRSDSQIAKKFGMKEETVTKIRKRAIIKLRKLLEVEKGS